MTVPIRKVIAVSGTYGDLLTLECRHVISIEPNGEPPKHHECWQCKQAHERRLDDAWQDLGVELQRMGEEEPGW